MWDEGVEAGGEGGEIPMGDEGLGIVGVAALGVGVVADVAAVVVVEETEWAVVYGQPQCRHVVGIHHAVAEADALPCGDGIGGAVADLFQQGGVGIVGISAVGVVMPDEVVGKLLDFGFAAGVIEVFEMAETQKARGDAGQDGGGFDGFPINGVVAAAQGEGAGRGDAETVHGFGTEVFADGGAQDGAPVGKAGIGRFARTFELPLLALSRGIDGIANQDRAPVAKTRGIDAELMAAVNTGNGRGRVLRGVAAEVGKVGGRLKICIQIQLCRQIGVEGDPVGRGQRLRGNAGIEKRREFGELLGKQGECVHGIPDGRGRVCITRGYVYCVLELDAVCLIFKHF